MKEETKQLDGTVEIIKPVTVRVYLSGRARRDDGKYNVKWFDGTIKVIDNPDFEYTGYNFNRALQEVTALYQLNNNTILTIKLSTI